MKVKVGKTYKAILMGEEQLFKVVGTVNNGNSIQVDFLKEGYNDIWSKVNGYPVWPIDCALTNNSIEVKTGGVQKGSSWSIDRHIAQINKRLSKQIDINCRAAKNYLNYQVTKSEQNHKIRNNTQMIGHYQHLQRYAPLPDFIGIKNRLNELLQSM